ncbi:XRE family transcriptional regulator [Fulvimarina endophytica]|uniref:XRE family transcriptional regulator n=1 Tax=Fulvimarina endophytica TaxID=2293836 RepID=A0A371X0J1_9HYPH|nr:helix-turn-helix transcriptional regulator [Fulvimarina endophytica]RFC62732.1 XRE family transcriptional regulator [Fulvimarina endophytica]
MSLESTLDTIRKEAKRQGLTGSELARRASLTKEAYSRLGKRNGARFDTIERLAAAVGMKVILVPDDDYLEALATGTLGVGETE